MSDTNTLLDPRLDRKRHFDPRSRTYRVEHLWADAKSDSVTLPRSYTWGCRVNLNQGREGACVAFGWSHERAAKPKPDNSLTDNQAMAHYHRIQEIDRAMGNNWSDGASVLAGAKMAQEAGWMTEYRWAFNMLDALTAISRHGPAVIGIDWLEGCDDVDGDGFIHYTGSVRGGHCILVRGVNVRDRFVVLHNSWGNRWGGTEFGPGTAKLSWDDFEKALGQQGECCVPVTRRA